MAKQPTVREINGHTRYGQGYCYVYRDGRETVRISRARTRKGVMEGRLICYGGPDWIVIGQEDHIELTRG